MYIIDKAVGKINYEMKNTLQNYLNHKITLENKELNEKYYNFLISGKFSETEYEPNEEEIDIFRLSNNKRNEVLNKYKDKYKGLNLKIGIHIPRNVAGISLFNNWIEGLNYLGVESFNLGWTKDEVQKTLIEKKPSIIITSHHDEYLEKFDWTFIETYKNKNGCEVVFVVFDPHLYNRELRKEKFLDAKKKGINTYICFWLEGAKNYFKEYYEEGFNVLSIPFSANPLKYYYLPMEKKLDYIFLGTGKGQFDKSYRYIKYFRKIFCNKNFKGIINGPGWYKKQLILPSNLHSQIYSMGNIGLNLHITDSIKYYSELNERTYILAISGIFQLIDNPRALQYLFPNHDSIVSCNNSFEYYDKFQYYLVHQHERTKYIKNGIDCVYKKDTIFHRMDSLVNKLIKLKV